MLIIIPPTVKVASATSVTSKTSFLMNKSPAGGGGARRALAALGTNNAQLNMNMAKSHLAIVQEGFMSRWNFNPVKEIPLASGRYQWAPLVCGSGDKNTSTPSLNVAKDSILLKDITNPALTCSPSSIAIESTNNPTTTEGDNKRNCTVSTSASDQENSENEAKPETKCKQVLGPSCETFSASKKNATSGSQMSLTDFFRPAKRKSCNQYEDCHPNTGSSTPPKKKLRTVHYYIGP